MKLGIVFEGGASRTVFSAGVGDVFLDEGIVPDYFVGVSAGIAFGISYLSGQKGRNLRIATEYMNRKEYQGMRHLFNPEKKCFYNVEYAFDKVPNQLLPFDYEAFAGYKGKVVATVTNIHTGRPEYLEVSSEDKHFKAVLASCALPVFFKPVKVGNHYYLDGGLTDSLPYEQAFKEGCDKVIVVMTRQRGYVKKPEPASVVSSALYKDYPEIVRALKLRPQRYNASVQKLHQLEKEGKVFVIAPDNLHGVGRCTNDKVRLEALYREGYMEAREQMVALKKYLSR